MAMLYLYVFLQLTEARWRMYMSMDWILLVQVMACRQVKGSARSVLRIILSISDLTSVFTTAAYQEHTILTHGLVVIF